MKKIKWEYKHSTFGVRQKVQDAIDYSNDIGQDGWEMCGIVKSNGVPCYIFKRPLKT